MGLERSEMPPSDLIDLEWDVAEGRIKDPKKLSPYFHKLHEHLSHLPPRATPEQQEEFNAKLNVVGYARDGYDVAIAAYCDFQVDLFFKLAYGVNDFSQQGLSLPYMQAAENWLKMAISVQPQEPAISPKPNRLRRIFGKK